MLRDSLDRRAGHLFKIFLLAFIAAFGCYEIFVYSDRSVWGDEISSLINYPLARVTDIFAPLPYAQQAAPASFNLLSTAVSSLQVRDMRILFSILIIAAFLIAAALAFRFRSVPMLGALAFIASSPIFFQYATELKFYGFEMAGAAFVAAWVIRYDTNKPLGLVDLGVLVFAAVMGISTLVIAICGALTVFCIRVAKCGWVAKREAFLLLVLGAFGVAYYLQIQYSVRYQIETFPDAYSVDGLRAVLKFTRSIVRGYGFLGVFIVGVIFAVLLFHSRTSSEARRLLAFAISLYAVFCLLAALGKYPAISPRHIAWTAGIFSMAAGLAARLALGGRIDFRRRISGGILVAALAANFASSLPELLSRDKNHTDNDKLISWLKAADSSNIVLYNGGGALKVFMEKSGFQVGQHQYFGELNLESGKVDPVYLSEDYLSQDYDAIAADVMEHVAEPGGGARMAVTFRILRNYRGYADYVIDKAPTRAPFHIIATHVDWNSSAHGGDPRYTSLLEALSERGCEYFLELSGKKVFAMSVTCPQSRTQN